MKVLVTGGTGYIGSHTVVELLNNNMDVVVIDDFSNSKPEVLENIKKITGKDFRFYEVNYLDREKLEKVFEENPDIESVINFAGFKAVGESVKKPLEYYINNVSGALVLLDTMKKYNVKNLYLAHLQLYMEKKIQFHTLKQWKPEKLLTLMEPQNYLLSKY